MTQTKIGKHAVIVGGGFVGLLTSRVLSDYFDKVTIIERDLVTNETMFKPRSGVPQASHVHFLTTKGRDILLKFFPKLEEALLAHGALKADLINDSMHYQYDSWKPRFKSGKNIFVQSRALLEGCLRFFLKDFSNVHFLYQNEAYGLLADPKLERLTGVRVRDINTKEEQNIYADLIVDTSGRNTHFPEWFEGLGFQRPPKTEVKIDTIYLTREFILPDNFNPDWKLMTLYRKAPALKKSGVLVTLESSDKEKHCFITLIGLHGDYPISTEEGYLEFARQLESPALYDIIKQATPISPPIPFKVPITWRYRYSKLKNLPAGFVAAGDSICALNPIYAQGMSVGAQAVCVLEKIIRENPQTYLNAIRQNYFIECEKIIDIPWDSTTLHDFFFPQTEGKRPFGLAFSKWYITLVRRSAENLFIWKRLVEIANLEKSPKTIFSPAIFIRALPKLFS